MTDGGAPPVGRSLDDLRQRRTRAALKLGVALLVVLVPIVIWILGSTLTKDDAPEVRGSGYTTGDQIAVQLRAGLADAKTGAELSEVSCPNQRLIGGDEVRCRVTFADGSFRDIEVTIERVDSDGSARIGVDVAG